MSARAYGLTAANVYGPSFGRHHLIKWWFLTWCGKEAIETRSEPPEGSVLCRKCAGVEQRRAGCG